jgi:hypothetical protein
MLKNCATATNWRNHAVADACGGGSQQSFPPESWIDQKARKKLAEDAAREELERRGRFAERPNDDRRA